MLNRTPNSHKQTDMFTAYLHVVAVIHKKHSNSLIVSSTILNRPNGAQDMSLIKVLVSSKLRE